MEDFLLISSFPNFFDEQSLFVGDRIVAVAGANGAGTRAVRLLLENVSALMDLVARTRKLDVNTGWQAVIHVAEVEREGSFPTKLGQILFFEELSLDFKNMLGLNRAEL